MGFNIYNEFVSLDIETTGLVAARDKIIEIGSVRFKDGRVVDEFRSFVNPKTLIPSKITQITGITDSMVKDAPSIEHVLPQFIKFAGSSPIVAHNASFDMGFIRHNASLLGLNINNTVVCTLQLCRKTFLGLSNHKLDTVARHLNISLKNHHRAIDDSLAAALIYLKCIEASGGSELKNVE